ncbi:hypothetical protein CL6EHI_012130 [Entamoeba histolytica]|nr:hypothetical protein CL6EHI_012130 [Entamoeba histolytica]
MILLFYCIVCCIGTFISPCVSTFKIGLIDQMDEFGISIESECYDNIPNAKDVVKGLIIESECYIHESLKDEETYTFTTRRCGSCLGLSGPSMKSYQCMISGFFKINNATDDPFIIDYFKRTVLVKENMFEQVTGQIVDEFTFITEVSVQQQSCRFNTIPQLLTNESKNKSIAIHIFDTNIISKYLRINNTLYKMNDGHYEIPESYIGKDLYIDVILISNVVIPFNIHSLQLNTLYSSSLIIPLEHTTNQCFYSPNTIILNTTIDSGVKFDWSALSFDSSENVIFVDENKNGWNVISTDQNTIVIIYYDTPHLFGEMYSEFNVTLTFEKNNTIKLNDVSIVLINDFLNNNLTTFNSSISNLCSKLNSKTYYSSNQLSIRTYIPINKCTGYFNGIVLNFTTINTKSFLITSSYLIERELYSTAKYCDINAFSCNKTQCSGTNSTIIGVNNIHWVAGCEPVCDSCAIGYSCNTDGICVVTPNHNTRSKGVSIKIVITMLIILIILL